MAGGLAGTLLTSSDGVSWTNQPPFDIYPISGLAYGNGNFVAAVSSSYVFVSSNGVAWTFRSTGNSQGAPLDVTFGNGLFVAVGIYGRIVTSGNLINWTPRPFAATVGQLTDVTHGAGMFVAAGSGNSIQASPDGAQWTSHATPILNTAGNVAYGDGVFVLTVSFGEVLLQSDAVASLRTRVTTQPELGLEGIVGGVYAIEALGAVASENLWTNVATLTLTNSLHWWTDPVASSAPQRFYRSILLP